MLSRFFFSFSLFLLLFPSFLLIPQPASAAAFGLVPCALQNDNPATNWDDRAPCTLCHFLIGMNFVVKFLRNLMTAIAIAIMVAMAIMYIVSAGNEDMMATAKKGIIGSLIGIVVILLAWVIVNFIFTLPIFANNGLVRTDGSWDTFTCNTTSQVGWTGKRNTSSISQGTGSVGDNNPGREGLPGAIPEPENPPNPLPPPAPPAPPGGGGGGGGNTGGGGTTPPGGVPRAPSPKCGQTHYLCDEGFPHSMRESGSGALWMWTCGESEREGSSTNLDYCRQKKAGCGDGDIDSGEECDTGAQLGSSCSHGATCDILCRTCGEGPIPPAPLACGPSDGTSSAPVEPLCIGTGAIASSVTTSAVGTSSRYDWTCSKDGLAGSLNCSSGMTSFGGKPTATCGPAAGVASVSAPSSGLCGIGELSIYGVNPLIHAVTGEPLWSWGCVISRSQGGTRTSCYAPRIVP